MLTRLSGVEALSLHTESAQAPGHTIAVIIIEASPQLSHQRLHQLLAASLPQLARFRSRLVAKPLGVGQPIWAEIDDYDPTPQIHCATVGAPGGQREFAELIAYLSIGRQDRRRPLWEAWSIDGLAGGQWALAVKMSGRGTVGMATAAEPRAGRLGRQPGGRAEFWPGAFGQRADHRCGDRDRRESGNRHVVDRRGPIRRVAWIARSVARHA
jgi:hypothetical protein